MAGFGRFNGQFPIRFGRGEPLSRKIYRGLNAQLGTGYDTSEESTVTAETAAEARLIAAAWRANDRASQQLDPYYALDFLQRWETILHLSPSKDDTLSTRRSRVMAKRTAIGDPSRSTLESVCSAALGDMYAGVEYTPLASAVIHWPGNGYADEWYSTTAHLLIRVQQPAGVSIDTMIAAANGLMQILADLLPDYTTFEWGIYDGDAGSGFILDDPLNLDFETFDS